ncbi:hypothetical protein FMK81_13245 [Klebsiella oxytoca]|uniref:ParB N-terminal domain-containing protein n=1 Tax=Klebsiella oxytoca TaxID=571 RepID=UPI001CCFEC46|nr:ParB N-terminal domain-containing protein [Klebsiella oxytoca]MBZ7262472.1 hypothetical protein [Klebsiella oxytoca]
MPLDIEIIEVDPKSLKLLEKNAHYMEPAEFERLVGNIKKDGVLTSTPVVYRGTVLSGNHRAQASVKAGLDSISVINIKTELTEDQQKAIQLSHNAINGKDDKNILQELFDSIQSLDMKLYSGLTDDAFKITDIDVQSLSFIQPIYEEMTIAFLPEEKNLFVEALENIGKKAKDRLILAGRMEDYNRVFRAVIDVKSKLNIINTAEAFKTMAELAIQKLEEIDGEAEDNAGSSDSGISGKSGT